MQLVMLLPTKFVIDTLNFNSILNRITENKILLFSGGVLFKKNTIH